MIRVRLHFPWGLTGHGHQIAPGESELLLPQRTSVKALLDSQGIPLKIVGLVAVNGSATKMDYVLNDLDKIQIYPPLEGG